ncbi:MAG: thiamine diphosphokinase [Alkalispirochaetaceae bacterium]
MDHQYRRGVLFTGGEGPDAPPADLDLRGAMVVAADSGLSRAVGWGVEPDLILGDMDSLNDTELLDRFPRERVRRFEEDKDYTDTELGLRALEEAGVEEITIVGGGGGRLDHLLGIVALFDRDNYPRRWYTGTDRVDCVDRELLIRGAAGQTLSVFPAGREGCRMQSEGLKWPLDKLSWVRGDAGISNLVVAEICRIRVTQGRIIVVRSPAKDSL